MTLHQTGIENTTWDVRRLNPHAAFRLLQEDGEDEASVEIRCLSDAFDGIEDLICFLRRVIGHAPVIVAARVHNYITVEALPVTRRIRKV